MPRHLSHHRLHSSISEIRADLRSLSRLAQVDIDAAEDAYIALDPYIEQPGGGVYVFLQRCDDPALQHVDVFVDLKVGKANDVAHRRRGHQSQCPDIHRVWAYFYPTTRPMLIERLVHLRLDAMGARRSLHPCAKCLKHHKEFYGEELTGGLDAVAALIEAKIRKIGDIPICIPLIYDS
ncbi:hypothetical protein K438DRAFT_1975941 [Mycena galopus ATCC 62051]|nr:hypothetical protein K438DRAFT_1975941 [Mycena galopus ATCC 62051]